MLIEIIFKSNTILIKEGNNNMTSFRLIFRIGDEFFDTTDNRYGLEKDLIFINSKDDSEIISIETIEEE